MFKITAFLLAFTCFTSVWAQLSSEDSASVNLTGGNTDLETYRLESKNKYKRDEHSFSLKGDYNYGESDKIRSAENWEIGIRYDLTFAKHLGFYLGESAEADRFAGVKRRYNSDLGLKYTFIENDKTNLFSEGGYRYSIEKNEDETKADKKDSKGRLYSEVIQKFRSDFKGRLWIEYLPNFSESEDFLINVEPSLSLVLASIFSLKTAYLWKYDNQPPEGKGKHDYQFTLTLIANIQ